MPSVTKTAAALSVIAFEIDPFHAEGS